MAAPTTTQVMQGIATRLATISGLTALAFKPSQLQPPVAYVSLPQIDYHAAFAHGTMSISPTVTVVVPVAMDRVDQPTLAAYADIAGAQSIHAAIEADRTLGLSANGVDCIVVNFQEQNIVVGGIEWPAGVFTLKVIARGS